MRISFEKMIHGVLNINPMHKAQQRAKAEIFNQIAQKRNAALFEELVLIRKACEKKAKSLGFQQTNLDCMCAIAACALAYHLQNKHYKNIEIHWGKFRNKGDSFNIDHCWVMAKDIVLDVTATQFDVFVEEKHVILNRQAAKKLGYKFHLNPSRQIKVKDEAVTKLFKSWGVDHKPDQQKIKKILSAVRKI